MRHKKKNAVRRDTDSRMDLTQAPVAVSMTAVAAILMGLFMMFLQTRNKPIERTEAVAYAGRFAEYEVWRNYRIIHFEDGSTHEVYAHTETQEFRDKMESMEPGTTLYLLVNPNNDCVIEIKTDTEEILNFETSQQEIDAYDNGYIVIGGIACGCGLFLLWFAVATTRYRKREQARQTSKKVERIEGQNDTALRRADETVRCRILLKKTVEGYRICYRRVKHTNELVVNGWVYDEKKGIIEFAHCLSAHLDGHTIQAGLDNDNFSYIRFDGETVAEKRRLI